MARMKALRSAIMLALCYTRKFARGEASCPPSSPTAFSAISTSCARSAPTRPACTGRRSRPRTSRRATGSPSNAPPRASRPRSTASATFWERARRAAPRRCPARIWKARTMRAGSTAPLGCVYALEASRAIKEAGGDAGVDVVVFCDEEGHYGSFLGIEVVHRPAQGRGHRQGGEPPRRHADARGARRRPDGTGRPRVTIEPSRYKAFFEAHIEQGDTLESERAAHRRRHRDRGDLAVFVSRRPASRTTPAPPR